MTSSAVLLAVLINCSTMDGGFVKNSTCDVLIVTSLFGFLGIGVIPNLPSSTLSSLVWTLNATFTKSLITENNVSSSVSELLLLLLLNKPTIEQEKHRAICIGSVARFDLALWCEEDDGSGSITNS